MKTKHKWSKQKTDLITLPREKKEVRFVYAKYFTFVMSKDWQQTWEMDENFKEDRQEIE